MIVHLRTDVQYKIAEPHKRFKQISICENRKFVGLITSTGITYWLADKEADDIISREIPTFLDIHYLEKQKNTYRFIERTLFVYEVEENLLGIIAPLDLIRID